MVTVEKLCTNPMPRPPFKAILELLSGMAIKAIIIQLTGSPNSFLQVIVPEKIQTNTSDSSEIDYEQISYSIPIDEWPYTIHLKQRYFVADNFMIYLYKQGSVNSHSSNIQTRCYYQGHIEGYPNSYVTLSTCSGLRGILQFKNVSYGIEPMASEIEFLHLLYKLKKENDEYSIFSNRDIEKYPMDSNIFISEKSEQDFPDLIPLYLEIHIVVDNSLYDYWGSDSVIITHNIIEILGLVNLIFTQFKVTVVLSSLDLWSDKNKISTDGEADELLRRFLEWKQSYLTLRPHDTAYLFIYRDYPNYMGATFSGKICVTSNSAGVVLECGANSCCDPENCVLRHGAQCYTGPCCTNCQFAGTNVECRPKAHAECDVSEFCNGSSSLCVPDITIQNGNGCQNNIYVCFNGECSDPDKHCESIYGKGSRQAPFACYEEIHSHTDTFGNCGKDSRSRYVSCPWRGYICGRLVCTYPTQAPFYPQHGDVIYAYVRGTVCISMEHPANQPGPDPLRVKSGTPCDTGRICLGHTCSELRIIRNEIETCSQKCFGHGVCKSNMECNCTGGYLPPNCESLSRESPEFPEEDLGLIEEKASRKTKITWLLGVCTFLVIIVIAMVALTWNCLKKWFIKEEESKTVVVRGKKAGTTPFAVRVQFISRVGGARASAAAAVATDPCGETFKRFFSFVSDGGGVITAAAGAERSKDSSVFARREPIHPACHRVSAAPERLPKLRFRRRVPSP
ncbi:disintegrin and metalloproteinase domain-containing protein 32-like [Otolemur garnettii]|uniref:disintegrin and metalloproteinase domain-containing protein 32-like n=1 Tax=Otolemur garnettii TaxID=30611 RepID=UPI00064430CE|nr:disintegrin and metalloproteinase domain-containing protein 32-like [Otolemur garnettii]